MPKRKWSHNKSEAVDSNLGSLPDRALCIREKQVEQKIAIGRKALSRALKLAKGFERQKLGRKLKAARAEGDAVGFVRLSSEVELLKKLDLPKFAEAHIYKTLAKSKPISYSPAFPQCVLTTLRAHPAAGNGRKTEQDTAGNNVMARLYNSKPVKDAMAIILKAVQTSIGLEDVRNNENQGVSKDQKNNKTRASSLGRLTSNDGLVGGNVGATVESGVGDKERSSDKAVGLFSSENERDGLSLLKCDNRIAEARSEGNDLSCGCDGEDGNGMIEGRNEVSPGAYNSEADLPLSSLPSESSSSPQTPFELRKRKKLPAAPKSTFLPSLMGGYWSGSEAAEERQSADLRLRKNRMGQRARRQLWENKFGAQANHLRVSKRGNNWDPKREAKAANRGGPRHTTDSFRGIDVATKYSRTGNGLGEGRSPGESRSLMEVNEGPLHPSWEAAKKAKKQAMQATFQGKKIVFD